MAKTVILAVAPVAHDLPKGCACGLSAEGVARDVIDCARAGASMVHLHVRDNEGYLSKDLSVYDETIRLIRAQSDIVVQGSTGGESTLTREQRCVAVRHPMTEVASLNIGSTNFGDGVYVNTILDIRYWAGQMRDERIVPEMEIFDLSMVGTARRLLKEGLVRVPLMSLALGFENSLEASEHHMDVMLAEMRRIPGAIVGLCQHDMRDFALFRHALECGADIVRVGFEDGHTLDDGRMAASNLQLVEDAVRIIRGMGLEVATPDEARSRLGIRREAAE